jgi:hypothetical protein
MVAASMSTKHYLPFVFVGRRVRWKTLGDEAAEGQDMHEVHSLPGRLVAWGPTKAEAIERLMETLELAFSRSGSPRKWYEVAKARMSKADEDTAERCWGAAFTDPSRVLERQTNGDEVRAVEAVEREECLTP